MSIHPTTYSTHFTLDFSSTLEGEPTTEKARREIQQALASTYPFDEHFRTDAHLAIEHGTATAESDCPGGRRRVRTGLLRPLPLLSPRGFEGLRMGYGPAGRLANELFASRRTVCHRIGRDPPARHPGRRAPEMPLVRLHGSPYALLRAKDLQSVPTLRPLGRASRPRILRGGGSRHRMRPLLCRRAKSAKPR